MPATETTKIETRLLPIAELDRSRNHRKETPAERAAVAELAKTLEADGQLVPVVVFPNTDEGAEPAWVLAAGFRRCAALELLGHTHVRAEIHPAAPDIVIEKARAAENLHRRNLSPMEEAIAVRAVAQHLGFAVGVPPEQFSDYDAIAREVGMPIRWVSDRIYLARLCPDVVKLVESGRLQLGHAREIAKLGDAGDQKSIANAVALDKDGAGHVHTIEQVRRMVEMRRRSLKVVSWNLGEAFAKRPACVGCKDNTLSDPVLFDTGSDEPAAGYCLNGKCFEAKQKAFDKVKVQVRDKLAKKKIEPTLDAVRHHAPTWAKESSVQRFVKKELAPAPAPAPGSAPGSGSASASKRKKDAPQSDTERRTAALGRYAEAFNKWRDRLTDRIMRQCTGLHRAGLLLLLTADVFHRDVDYFVSTWKNTAPPKQKGCSPLQVKLIQLAAASTPEALIELAGATTPGKHFGCCTDELGDFQPDILVRLAEALKLDFDPEPAFESFLPKDLRPGAGAAEKKEERRAKSDKKAGKGKKGKGHDDPRVNEHGVFLKYATIVIPTPKKTMCLLRIAQSASGTWHTGYDYEHGQGGACSAPSLNGEQYATADDALNTACEMAKGYFRAANKNAAVAAIETFEFEHPQGKCAACGCTEDAACAGGCSWVDADRILCSACVEGRHMKA